MTSLYDAQQVLLMYSLLMGIGMVAAWGWSRFDLRTFRGVGIWVKPLKFMSATALFALTSAGLMQMAEVTPAALPAFYSIAVLIVSTSAFEVAYISLQASLGEASHYNTSDALHAAMSGLMGIVAVCLTASQVWLAWVIWLHHSRPAVSLMQIAIVTGLILTFVLATVSGFLLGARQPAAGKGLPLVGWHVRDDGDTQGDMRPAHFLGVHAQQFIPAFGLLATCLPASFPASAGYMVFIVLTAAYVLAWWRVSAAVLRRVRHSH
ncbi:hypothetical protein [Undibacterium sp. TJN19]|uniref:hypothetical protein n=1 Tax=Undibacterium sp. TJN19 TaxID=3413055 RepID=UPI003BF12EF3